VAAGWPGESSSFMRVAFVVDHFPLISETFILQQIGGVLARGHEVDIYATATTATGPLHPIYTQWKMAERVRWRAATGFRTYRQLASVLWASAIRALRSPVLFFRCVVQSLRQGAGDPLILFAGADSVGQQIPPRYDAIHAHFAKQGLLAVRLRKLGLLAGPILTSFHGVDITSHHVAKKLGSLGQLFAAGEAFTHPSDYIGERARALGCPEGRQRKLYCGIDTVKFHYRARTLEPGSPVSLISVARFVEKKGLPYAIRAVAQLIHSGRNVIYHLIGGGPLHASLEALIRELGVESQIRLVGPQDDIGVRRYLDEAHIFVLPSVTAGSGDMEGLPVSILEAQMCGLPVVATLHSGIPEGVVDGGSAFLVPERDVDALAQRLGYLVDHPETWTAMGRCGRRHVEESFDIDKLNDDLVGMYESLAPAAAENQTMLARARS
jgi:colanic acid/amylovoran biosynthesis glycosyltransferase